MHDPDTNPLNTVPVDNRKKLLKIPDLYQYEGGGILQSERKQ
jgi:hypothetical protein